MSGFIFVLFFNLGHTLLERYGMTEIGMALSNPLHGPRVPVRLICLLHFNYRDLPTNDNGNVPSGRSRAAYKLHSQLTLALAEALN